MSSWADDKNAPAPDRFMERNVTDLQVTVGRFDERINGIRDTMVTKEDLANSKSETAWRMVYLMVPIVAASLGAIAILFANIATSMVMP